MFAGLEFLIEVSRERVMFPVLDLSLSARISLSNFIRDLFFLKLLSGSSCVTLGSTLGVTYDILMLELPESWKESVTIWLGFKYWEPFNF